jgi:hypothetical protein
VKWALDAGVLHLYGFEPGDNFAEQFESARAYAQDACAAVLYAEVFEGDPAAAALEAHGFALDSHERDVRDGRVTKRLCYLLVIGRPESAPT